MTVQTMRGPLDRETFMAAQRRHRRTSRWLLWFSAITVALAGLPLAVMLAPLVAVIVVVALDLANLVVDTPDVVERVGEWFDGAPPPASTIVVIAVAAVVPGMVLMVAVWVRIRSLIGHAGTNAVLATMEARPVDASDLVEQRFHHVVEEAAIAAGIPTPSVAVLPAGSAIHNAAVVGSDPATTTVVVDRDLLDALSRQEVHGLVAQLVASAANGDQSIHAAVLSLRLTVASVGAIVMAPIDRRSRDTVRALVGHRAGPDGAERVADLLTDLDRAGRDWFEFTDRWDDGRGALHVARQLVELPFVVTSGMVALADDVLMLFFGDPVIAWTLRRRCDLADATSVQLTRQPDGLAAALVHIHRLGPRLVGTPTTASTFVVDADDGDSPAEGPDDTRRANWLPTRPSVERRIERLRRLGAEVPPDAPARPRVADRFGPRRGTALTALGAIAAGALLLLAAALAVLLLALALCLVVLAMALVAVIDLLFIGVPLALLHEVLRSVA